ncbi:MAG TPA: DUF3891 family protein [Thermoanaerobaculia bacterium]|nr:DUF3891 family protein [Thermoanaerobaculia bacterium]
MIVVADGPQLLLVTQNDHAHFSGELLSLWRADDLPENPRRDDIVFAARQHDNGWREADAAPRVNPATGEPHGFLDLPAEHRIEVWRRGVRRYRDQRPYAALLIHEHALALHRAFGSGEEHAGLVAEVEASRAELLEQTGADEAMLLADYPLVRLTDLLSLVACRCFPGEREHAGRRFWRDGDALVIEPLPLAGATRFRIPCRRLERRSYAGDADLAGALAAARWEDLEVIVRYA